ncbi:MAG: lipopolysaccharide kinase InaA family protein, partial [Planctomycetota bacterium]
MNAPTDSADHRPVVLKDEPATTVVVLGSGDGAIVRKTYRNRGLRWLQSLWRRSRAQREHDHLAALRAAGLPCLEPLAWSERRRWLAVDESTLQTRFVPASRSLKQVLAALPPGQHRVRVELASAMGRLLGALHRAGFLWCTPVPRNVLVVGDPATAKLLVIDTPAAVAFRRSLHGKALARIDLYLTAFSASRRTDWSRSERLRLLLGYCEGGRVLARSLWRTLARRSRLRNVVER